MAGTQQTPAASSSNTASTATNTSASEERDLFKGPTFDGNNFPIWQRKVKTYLAVKSLMKCIEQPLPANATQEQKQEYVYAAAILSGHVKDDIYNHIITDANIHDAFAIWKELKNEYASSLVLAISTIISSLMRTYMCKGSMNPH
ncbi:hypothetical protein PTTG_29803 [Puccinia triticina 1-1 BBBD Race 1]|uniref:DUF4219 domain-containing protein n=1 Tax=Puccinia triticina (isolate 1-1 / race 1 (BBBD)) TaxID=630390 RepID=A0A180G1P7_PUCT1|nr:hypothetical protein PTTG_29803 [Puccinia triticina 1-1 BBBD Race 1]